MAVSPKQVLAPTQEEADLLKEVEARIDERLLKEYQPGKEVSFTVAKRWRPGFIQSIIDLYEAQGWRICRSVDGYLLSFWTAETEAEEVLTQKGGLDS